jgi:hypothetical protein
VKLIARAPIDASIAGRDQRSGDTFDIDDTVGAELVAAQLAEPVQEPGAKQKRAAG